METVNVELPAELVKAANLEENNLSQEAARLLALELYREDRVSPGRALNCAKRRWQHLWILWRNMGCLR